MPRLDWVGKHIEVDPPKKPLKITGTRFAAIKGANRWNTPFKVWCEITRTYKEPFKETIYTAAGKAIEPKQAAYIKDAYGLDNIISPKDVYGEDYWQKTYGDFFPNQEVFGGSWDFLEVDENNVPVSVFEMKTTKRSEDWSKDIPEYYAQQAALYAYLLGVDQVYMVCSFLSERDYEDPEKYEVGLNNTIIKAFTVSERYPQFDKMVKDAREWWETYIETGISPDYDEKADAEILTELKKNHLAPDADIEKLVKEAEFLQEEIDRQSEVMKDQEKKLDAIKKKLKEHLTKNFRDGDKQVDLPGKNYTFVLSRSEGTKLDEAQMKADNIYEKYLKPNTTYRFTVVKNKED